GRYGVPREVRGPAIAGRWWLWARVLCDLLRPRQARVRGKFFRGLAPRASAFAGCSCDINSLLRRKIRSLKYARNGDRGQEQGEAVAAKRARVRARARRGFESRAGETTCVASRRAAARASKRTRAGRGGGNI